MNTITYCTLARRYILHTETWHLHTVASHFFVFVPYHGTSIWYICVPLQVAEGRFSSRSDVWSIGVCVYAILCGQMPFETPDNTMLKKRDARALLTDITMTHPRWDEVSDTCKDLVR